MYVGLRQNCLFAGRVSNFFGTYGFQVMALSACGFHVMHALKLFSVAVLALITEGVFFGRPEKGTGPGEDGCDYQQYDCRFMFHISFC
jgi:hypothetical protein